MTLWVRGRRWPGHRPAKGWSGMVVMQIEEITMEMAQTARLFFIRGIFRAVPVFRDSLAQWLAVIHHHLHDSERECQLMSHARGRGFAKEVSYVHLPVGRRTLVGWLICSCRVFETPVRHPDGFVSLPCRILDCLRCTHQWQR